MASSTSILVPKTAAATHPTEDSTTCCCLSSAACTCSSSASSACSASACSPSIARVRKPEGLVIKTERLRSLRLVNHLRHTPKNASTSNSSNNSNTNCPAGSNSLAMNGSTGRSSMEAFQMSAICAKRKRALSVGTVDPKLDSIAQQQPRKKRTTKKSRDCHRVTLSKRCSKKTKVRRANLGCAVETALKQFRIDHFKRDKCYEVELEQGLVSGNAGDEKALLRIGVSHSQGARPYMEDRASVVTRLFPDLAKSSPTLVAVYDGHNGPIAAELAAKRFEEILRQDECLRDLCLRELDDDAIDKIRAILTSAFLNVEQEVLDLTIKNGKRDGTTVLLSLIVGSKLFVANVGDSRGVWALKEQQAERLSKDHKPDLEEEKERIKEAGGNVVFSGCWRVAHSGVPLRLAISRSLGDHPLKTNLPDTCTGPLVSAVPDIKVVDLSKGHFYVLASDGLWDRFSDEEAVESVRNKIQEYHKFKMRREHEPLSKESVKYAACSLVEAALAKRSMDNITAVVVAWKV